MIIIAESTFIAWLIHISCRVRSFTHTCLVGPDMCLYFFKKPGLSIPTLDKKKDKIGNSKSIPATSTRRSMKLMYSLMFIVAVIVSVPILYKKGKTIGIMTK